MQIEKLHEPLKQCFSKLTSEEWLHQYGSAIISEADMVDDSESDDEYVQVDSYLMGFYRVVASSCEVCFDEWKELIWDDVVLRASTNELIGGMVDQEEFDIVKSGGSSDSLWEVYVMGMHLKINVTLIKDALEQIFVQVEDYNITITFKLDETNIFCKITNLTE